MVAQMIVRSYVVQVCDDCRRINNDQPSQHKVVIKDIEVTVTHITSIVTYA